jgi:hypothetical protein
MKLEEVRNIAKARGIHPGKIPKVELIKALQVSEGNFACFSTAYAGECDQGGCLWRTDCFEAARKGALS